MNTDLRTRLLAPLRAYWPDALLLFLFGLLALWLRWPGLFTEGFHNEDTAGITYNADILRHGLLPAVDNLELKAPGSFYLVYFAWELFGRSLVVAQRMAFAWSLLGMIGIYVGGRLLYGRRSGAVAALLYTVASPITDSIDFNYASWMVTPYIWSTVAFVAAEKRGRALHYGASGVFLALAGLCKRQGAALFPVFVGLMVLTPLLVRPEGFAPALPRKKSLLWFFGGLAVGFFPILAWYALQGGLPEFVRYYFASEGGWRYVQGELTWADKWPRLGDGALGFWEYQALPALLALLGWLGASRGPSALHLRGLLLVGHFLMSFVGIALGFRFFKGYYVQTLPVLVWIAAHPDGALTRWLSREAWGRDVLGRLAGVGQLGILLLALSPALMGDISQLQAIRRDRLVARDLEAQKVSALIRAETTPEDTLWVWGRWAWPVYFHTDRLASTRYYKVLGILTTNLTNTWKRPTAKTRFIEEGPWREVMADLEAARPKFVVVSRNEDYSKFKAFRAFLAKDYQLATEVRTNAFLVYRRKPAPAVPAAL